ncbi:MAG: alpha/beta fold hydrolase [Melioribacteraceae bacterium]|nr:alpha/beta fold hydrolase [Melioribacteraceae bacterium]
MNFNPVIHDIEKTDPDFPPGMLPLAFKSKSSKLLATLFQANGAGPHKTVLLLHGFPGNEVNFDIAHVLRRAGYNIFVFHYRGMWGSEGTFGWKNSVEDVESAVKFLEELSQTESYRVRADEFIIVGHSMGGFAGLMNAYQNTKVKKAAFLAGFNFGLFAEMIKQNDMLKNISIERMKPNIKFINGADADDLLNEMIENSREFNLLNYSDSLSKKKILMIGAKYDQLAMTEIHHTPLKNILEQRSKENLTESIFESGHSFSDKRILLSQKIINWLKKVDVDY